MKNNIITPCAVCGEPMVEGEMAYKIYLKTPDGFQKVVMCESCANNKTAAEIVDGFDDADVTFEYKSPDAYADTDSVIVQ